MADRGADQGVVVALDTHGITGDGGDSGDQWLTVDNCALNGVGGTYIDTYHTYICGQFAGGQFLAGKDIDQLLFTAGGVFGREYHNRNTGAFNMGRQCFDGFRFVVFDTDHNMVWVAENGAEDFDALNNFCGALANRRVIGGDIGFALGGINNQCVYGALTTGIEFYR